MSSTSTKRQWLAQRPYILAIIISLLLITWMASGIMQAQELPETVDKQEQIIAKVKVETILADSINDVVELYGRTEPDRVTTLKAEINGRIVEVLAQRGARVNQGDIIAKLGKDDLPDQLKRAKALLKQREIEYRGAKKLAAKGLQGEVQLATAVSNLAAVKADIARIELALEKTVIRAPFDGVLNLRHVEQGDYVQSGDSIAMVADLEPLVVRAHVTEQQVAQLSAEQEAQIRVLNQGTVTGKVRYIASVADENTNTFRVEVAIANPDYQLLAGLSSEVTIPLETVAAIKVSPALLALDENGNIGVKSVQDNIVVFTPINMVKSESDGIWLTGLGSQADIITLGQGFVRAGDTVEAVYDTELKSVNQDSK